MKALAVSESEPILWRAVPRSALLLDPPGQWVSDPQPAEIVDSAEVTPPEEVPLPSRSDVLGSIGRAIR